MPSYLRANVVYLPTCLSASMVYVLMCLRARVVYVLACLCANVPKTYQLLIFMYKRAIQRANVSTGVPIFQTFLLQNVKGNFYTLLLYKKFYITLDIIVIHIMCICILHKNCIKLHFHTSCHITKKVWVFFCYFFSFLFLS